MKVLQSSFISDPPLGSLLHLGGRIIIYRMGFSGLRSHGAEFKTHLARSFSIMHEHPLYQAAFEYLFHVNSQRCQIQFITHTRLFTSFFFFANLNNMIDNMLSYTGGIVGLLVLILDLLVIAEVINSNRTMGAKVGWSMLVFFFPLVGLIFYL